MKNGYKIERNIPVTRKRKCILCSNSILPCPECKDTRYINDTKIIRIDSTMKEIVYKNEGNEADGFNIPGDIIIRLTPNQHARFEIHNNGYDIIYKKYIPMEDYQKHIPLILLYFNDEVLHYKATLNTSALNDIIHYHRIKSKGLSRKNGTRGDLLIQIIITIV